MANATLGVYVDWNNDGDYADSYEDISAYARSIQWSRGRNYASELTGRSTAGACAIVLDNRDGRFSPNNAAGDMYGNLVPRRKVKVTTTHGVNAWTYSEDLANSVGAEWNTLELTAAANEIADPLGYNTSGDRFLETTANDQHYIYRNFPTCADDEYIAFSFYVKPISRQYMAIQFCTKAAAWMGAAVFDVTGGTIYYSSNCAPFITSAGSGWYRIGLSINVGSGAVTPQFVLNVLNSAPGYVYVGDVAKGFYAWGAQFEHNATTASAYDKTIATAHPVTITQWVGYLDQIEPQPQVNLDHTAILTASGPLIIVNKAQAGIAMSTSVTTGTAIGAVLDAAGWPAGDRTIDTGQTTMARYWTGGKINALTALREIEETEAGFISESKDGKIVFEDRAHRLAAPHTASQASYGTAETENIRFDGIRQRDSYKEIYNDISATARVYDKSGTITLFTFAGNPIEIAAGATKTVWAGVSALDPSYAIIAVDSWGAITHSANSASNGSGDNETANVAITKTGFDDTCKLAIKNNAAHTVYLISLSVAGVAVIERDSQKATSEDATSIAAYGRSKYAYRGRFLSNFDEAQGFCDHMLALYKDPRAIVTFQVPANRSNKELNEALTRDISDRITISAPVSGTSLGISGDFFVERITHRIDRDKTHYCQLECSAVRTHSWAATGTAWTGGTYTPGGPVIPDDYIDGDMIGQNTITGGLTGNLAIATITADNIVANTITAAKIAAGTITTTEIKANTIEAGNIKAGTITTTEIKANTIAAGNIAAGAITATELNATLTITGNTIQTAASGGRVVIDSANGIRIYTATGLVGQFSDAGIAITGGEFDIKSASSGARIQLNGTNGLRAYNSGGTQVSEIGTDGYMKTNILRTLSGSNLDFANADESFRMQMLMAGGSITLIPYGYATTVGMIIAAIGSAGHVTLKYNSSTTILDAYEDYVDIIGNCQLSSGKVYKINGTQVVGAQGSAVADATGAGDVVAQLNTLLSRLRTHGLIAT